MSSNAEVQPQSLAQPKLYRLSWRPGAYSNFVVVDSSDITIPLYQWPTYLETTETNFVFAITETQHFFALYGTNQLTGENAWMVNHLPDIDGK